MTAAADEPGRCASCGWLSFYGVYHTECTPEPRHAMRQGNIIVVCIVLALIAAAVAVILLEDGSPAPRWDGDSHSEMWMS